MFSPSTVCYHYLEHFKVRNDVWVPPTEVDFIDLCCTWAQAHSILQIKCPTAIIIISTIIIFIISDHNIK